MKDFLELAAQRYSCRKFSDKPVEEEKIRKILQAATLAPTAKNGQPQHVIVVRSDEMRKKMKEASPCTFDAPVIFVMCGDVKNGWHDPYTGRSRAEMDVSIATTHMMPEAADLGLGSTWVCMMDPFKAHMILDLPEHMYPYCMLPVGYPAPDACPSERHAMRRDISEFTKEV